MADPKLTKARVALLKRVAVGPTYMFHPVTAKALHALGYVSGDGWTNKDWFACIRITDKGRAALTNGGGDA